MARPSLPRLMEQVRCMFTLGGMARLVLPLTGRAYTAASLSGTPVSSWEQDRSREGASDPEVSLCWSSPCLLCLATSLQYFQGCREESLHDNEISGNGKQSFLYKCFTPDLSLVEWVCVLCVCNGRVFLH